MRIPKYLSPTSLHLFMDSPEDFYMRYLCDTRQVRDPQTKPMSIGSSFDAYCKSYLFYALFGNKIKGSPYELDTIFETQVEPHNRDWAREHGKIVFGEYRSSGCVADLMLELNQSIGDPRFELSIQDSIETSIGEVPILGKPDVFFINSKGARVVYDWKVNGYCANRTTSPMKGYVKLKTRKNGSWDWKQHRDCVSLQFKGITINAATFLEDCNSSWADQLAIYSWLLGEPIGSEEVIFGIDQIVGPADKLRFAQHRLRIRPEYHYNLLELLVHIWDCIQKRHIFQDMSIEDSRNRCELLEEYAATIIEQSPEDKAKFNFIPE
ncbi:hypothetical protein LCGC14_1266180 [marine sediment metagenome]|uniref:PD-(D/E)XK endonuclease-like domain-containing protein n=1 Tax=marine sediment metagenome TaxID=412755 RepID=A0A0F9L1G1_9ZZZZ